MSDDVKFYVWHFYEISFPIVNIFVLNSDIMGQCYIHFRGVTYGVSKISYHLSHHVG